VPRNTRRRWVIVEVVSVWTMMRCLKIAVINISDHWQAERMLIVGFDDVLSNYL
jgi:hypothetical protein